MSQTPVQPTLLSDDPNYVVVKIAKQIADGEIVELVFRSLKDQATNDILSLVSPLHDRMKQINAEKLAPKTTLKSI